MINENELSKKLSLRSEVQGVILIIFYQSTYND